MLPFFMVPATIAPGAKAVTIKPADIDLLWHEWLRGAVTDEAVRWITLYRRNRTGRRGHTTNITELRAQANNEQRAEPANRQ